MSLIAAIAALGLAGTAQAAGPEDQAVGQASPADPPSTDPAMPPSTLSTGSSAENTRLAAIVPAGMSATEACAGFTSTDECATTLHASQNLGIPFPDLKSKVTGGQKLAAAIKELKPDVNVKAEVRKAEEQARADVRSTQR
jgi:hypothetical protein